MHTIDDVYNAIGFGTTLIILLQTCFTLIIIASRGRR